jgi:hypothetical protein
MPKTPGRLPRGFLLGVWLAASYAGGTGYAVGTGSFVAKTFEPDFSLAGQVPEPSARAILTGGLALLPLVRRMAGWPATPARWLPRG